MLKILSVSMKTVGFALIAWQGITLELDFVSWLGLGVVLLWLSWYVLDNHWQRWFNAHRDLMWAVESWMKDTGNDPKPIIYIRETGE